MSYGIECTIFKEIATRLNITWDVYTSDDKDKWGTISSNHTITGGALKFLSTRQVDVSFCSFWIEKNKLKYVELSRLWTTVCLKFLVPKPQPLREKWDLLFKPFSLSLWLLVFFSAMLTTITVWAFARIQKKIGYTRINSLYFAYRYNIYKVSIEFRIRGKIWILIYRYKMYLLKNA